MNNCRQKIIFFVLNNWKKKNIKKNQHPKLGIVKITLKEESKNDIINFVWLHFIYMMITSCVSKHTHKCVQYIIQLVKRDRQDTLIKLNKINVLLQLKWTFTFNIIEYTLTKFVQILTLIIVLSYNTNFL